MIRTVSPAFLSAFFLAFRLTYAPVVGFFHTEHGAPWLVTGLILLLALGGEWLRRRIDARSGPGPLSSDPTRRRRATLLVILALILLGFTPEEGLIGLILWTAIGLAWAGFGRHLLKARELLTTPLYALWKVPVYLAYFLKRKSGWVRTKRDAE